MVSRSRAGEFTVKLPKFFINGTESLRKSQQSHSRGSRLCIHWTFTHLRPSTATGRRERSIEVGQVPAADEANRTGVMPWTREPLSAELR